MKRARIGLLLVSCIFLFQMHGHASESELVSQAQGELAKFKRSLMGALVNGLKSGPEHALEVCRYKAPELAASAQGQGIGMGRTSHKVRNPANRPEPWMHGYLDEYIVSKNDRKPRWKYMPDGRFAYVEPIYVKGLCLKCHGPDIKPEIRERLRSLYPHDKATGFKRGAFRGLFWVVIEPTSR